MYFVSLVIYNFREKLKVNCECNRVTLNHSCHGN